jgi:hypothetical protein
VNANKIIADWRTLLASKKYLFSFFLSLVIWVGGYFIYEKAIRYLDGLKGLPAVGDLFLDVLPMVDLRYIYIYGIVIVMAVIWVYVLVRRPDLLPFGLKFFAAVFIVRTLFIILTHLGPPEGFYIPAITGEFAFWPLSHLLHSNDLFFSGHVSYPFMGALLLRQNKFMFWFLLSASIVMGATVLLMRIHYSIDVFAAFFIVYGLYSAVRRIFGKTDLSFAKLINK